jgi:sugar phosphate permease
MILELFPSALAATATGVANTACFAGVMVLPIGLGRIADVTGGFEAVFLVIAATHVLGFLAGLAMRETGRRRVGGSVS